jgi:ATP-dependent Clp protease ATP-binding subunit ClpB
VAEIQLGYLRRRLAEREMGLVLSPAAMDKLTAAGFDPVYGARPLKRAIQHLIENPLAQAILAGRFGPGDRVTVDVAGNALVFGRGASATAADGPAEGEVIEGEIVD